MEINQQELRNVRDEIDVITHTRKNDSQKRRIENQNDNQEKAAKDVLRAIEEMGK